MARKKSKLSNVEDTEIESTAVPPETTGFVPTEPPTESIPSGSEMQEQIMDQPSQEQMLASQENGSSDEDLLDDVRRSLIEEEETDKSKKEARWWRRIGRKDKSTDPEPPSPIVEIDLPATLSQADMIVDQKQATQSDEYAKNINDLIDILEAEYPEPEVEISSLADGELPPEPEAEIDFEQLKEQAFRQRTSDDAEMDHDVRSIALEGGEEVFVEVEAQKADPFEERLKSIENALQPYRRAIYMTSAFLGVVMAVIASFIIYNVYKQSLPEPVKEVSNLPYPTTVLLPGGWSFNLGKGNLLDGKWEPRGAEWLEGTEVCRWVSLPWSLQLEAVIRTLNAKDPIELGMSNNDKLVYFVYSVYEMTPEEIRKQDSGSPCLLLILTQSDSEKRWVLTALP